MPLASPLLSRPHPIPSPPLFLTSSLHLEGEENLFRRPSILVQWRSRDFSALFKRQLLSIYHSIGKPFGVALTMASTYDPTCHFESLGSFLLDRDGFNVTRNAGNLSPASATPLARPSDTNQG